MKKLIAWAIITSMTGICFAQDKPMVKKEQPAKQKRAKENSAPVILIKQEPDKPPIVKFSIGMLGKDRIDLGYNGFKASEVVDAIENMTGAKKGEFESTADYQARKAAALTGKLLGDSSLEDTFAFVLPVRRGGSYTDGLSYEFDADNSNVRLYILPKASSMNGIGAPDHQPNKGKSEILDYFDLDLRIDSKSTYQGSNAYGATVTVEKTRSTKWGVAASRIPFLHFKRELLYSSPIPAAYFNIENSKAALELPTLKALLVVKARAPYVFYNFYYSEPTRDRPYEMTIQGKYLSGEVLGVVFYSGKTGDVFARVPDSFGKIEPTVEQVSGSQ